MSEQAAAVVLAYYDAFNRGDWSGMVALLTEDVAHDINQGAREIGREPFRRFLAHMEACYREELRDVVVLTEPLGQAGRGGIRGARHLSRDRPRSAAGKRPRPMCCLPARSSNCGTGESPASPTTTISRTGYGRSAPEGPLIPSGGSRRSRRCPQPRAEPCQDCCGRIRPNRSRRQAASCASLWAQLRPMPASAPELRRPCYGPPMRVRAVPSASLPLMPHLPALALPKRAMAGWVQEATRAIARRSSPSGCPADQRTADMRHRQQRRGVRRPHRAAIQDPDRRPPSPNWRPAPRG